MCCKCPYCGEVLMQDRNAEGLNFCTNCRNLFLVPPQETVQPWILGVLVILTAIWQMQCR